MRSSFLRAFAAVIAVISVTALASCADTSSESSKQPSVHAAAEVKPPPPQLTTAQVAAISDYITGLQREQVGNYIAALERDQVANYIAALETQAAVDRAASARPAVVPSQSVYSTSNPGDFLSCVRNRESGGNYGIYNSEGSGAAGAYQFLQGTWDSTAAAIGRTDLIGVSPANASPADQDMMAQALYSMQGAAPWGGGC